MCVHDLKLKQPKENETFNNLKKREFIPFKIIHSELSDKTVVIFLNPPQLILI